MNAPQHRADAVFTLPRLPRTAALVGDLPGWAEDLAERQMQVVDGAAEVAGLADPEWALLVSSGSIVRRDAFLLFPPGEWAPAQVLKFGRVPGVTVQFERDARGAEATKLAGNVVARRAPAQLGRFEVA